MKEYLTLQELKRMKWSTIERLQDQRFSAIVHHMLPFVKAYHDLFKQYRVDFENVHSVRDWKTLGLPLLTKAYYKNHPEDFIVKIHPSQAFAHYQSFLREQESAATIALFFKALTHRKALEKEIKEYYFPKMPAFSGGTESGKPTPVFITARQKQNMQNILAIATELILSKFKPTGDIIGMNLFPYGPHLGWHAVHLALDIASDLNLSTAAGGAISTEKLVEMAEIFKANIFAGMSDYLRNRWLQVAIEKKAKLAPKALFVNGASKMYEGERKKIMELARKVGVKEALVLDFFGASEFKEDLLPECAPDTGFHHIAPLSTIIQTVRAESPEKGGWIHDWHFVHKHDGGYGVVWNIDGAGTLLEGYLIGDIYKKITHLPCDKCGLRVERIIDISRIKEVEAQLSLTGMVEAKIKGARIDLAAVRNALLKLHEVAEAQIIARKNQLLIRIAPATTKQRAEAKAQTVLQHLNLEVTPKIEWTTVEKLTREDAFKFRGIIVES